MKKKTMIRDRVLPGVTKHNRHYMRLSGSPTLHPKTTMSSQTDPSNCQTCSVGLSSNLDAV